MFNYSLSDDLNDYGTEIRWLSTLYQPSLTCFISLVVVFVCILLLLLLFLFFFSFPFIEVLF